MSKITIQKNMGILQNHLDEQQLSIDEFSTKDLYSFAQLFFIKNKGMVYCINIKKLVKQRIILEDDFILSDNAKKSCKLNDQKIKLKFCKNVEKALDKKYDSIPTNPYIDKLKEKYFYDIKLTECNLREITKLVQQGEIEKIYNYLINIIIGNAGESIFITNFPDAIDYTDKSEFGVDFMIDDTYYVDVKTKISDTFSISKSYLEKFKNLKDKNTSKYLTFLILIPKSQNEYCDDKLLVAEEFTDQIISGKPQYKNNLLNIMYKSLPKKHKNIHEECQEIDSDTIEIDYVYRCDQTNKIIKKMREQLKNIYQEKLQFRQIVKENKKNKIIQSLETNSNFFDYVYKNLEKYQKELTCH